MVGFYERGDKMSSSEIVMCQGNTSGLHHGAWYHWDVHGDFMAFSRWSHWVFMVISWKINWIFMVFSWLYTLRPKDRRICNPLVTRETQVSQSDQVSARERHPESSWYRTPRFISKGHRRSRKIRCRKLSNARSKSSEPPQWTEGAKRTKGSCWRFNLLFKKNIYIWGKNVYKNGRSNCRGSLPAQNNCTKAWTTFRKPKLLEQVKETVHHKDKIRSAAQKITFLRDPSESGMAIRGTQWRKKDITAQTSEAPKKSHQSATKRWEPSGTGDQAGRRPAIPIWTWQSPDPCTHILSNWRCRSCEAAGATHRSTSPQNSPKESVEIRVNVTRRYLCQVYSHYPKVAPLRRGMGFSLHFNGMFMAFWWDFIWINCW